MTVLLIASLAAIAPFARAFPGEFRNFLAVGGRHVSARMERGKVVWMEIKEAK